LVEAPPDLMVSLKKLRLDFEKIDTIFISHLHGDHTFGLPFLIINKWINTLQGTTSTPLTILGPQGIEQHVKTVTEAAFSSSHPCNAWIGDNVLFKIISADFEMKLDGLSVSCFDVQHIVETYGLLLSANNQKLFAYISDTRWCQEVEQVLTSQPRIVLMDMNGGDPSIHVSLSEVIEKGLPITGSDTICYGTHLTEEFDTIHANIKCAKQGEEIVIDYENRKSNQGAPD